MANGRLKDPSLRWMVVLWMFEEGKDVLQKGSRNLEPANKYDIFFNKESYTLVSIKVRFVKYAMLVLVQFVVCSTLVFPTPTPNLNTHLTSPSMTPKIKFTTQKRQNCV